MNKKNISWGIIGCGDVTEVKSGPAFRKVENSTLVAVMRRNEDKVMDYAKRHFVEHWTTNASNLIENELVNAIYIATPPSSHLEYALKAIKAGKDVYLEKPMVLNKVEAGILQNAIKNSNVKVTIAHYRRCLPVFVKVKELIDGGFIGHVSSVKINISQSKNANLIAKSEENWRVNPEISGGGYFHDIAPHQIDLMCYYFGEILKIKGIDTEKNNLSHDVVCGEVYFKNGVKFIGNWNFDDLVDLDECTVYGDKGTILFSFYGDKIIVNIENRKETYQFDKPKHVQQNMIERTVGYFLGNNKNPCTVEEASVVTEIMDDFCGFSNTY